MPREKRAAPISNIKAEKALIGALLRSPHDWWGLNEIVRADYFNEQSHRDIYSAIAGIMEEGRGFSLALLLSRLPDEIDDQATGALLAALAHNADGLSAADFVGEVCTVAMRRRLVQAGEILVKSAKQESVTPQDACMEAQVALLDVSNVGAAKHVKSIGEIAAETVQQTAEAYQIDGKRLGMDTGIRALDSIIGPLFPGDLVSILGRSGEGKTTLATQILLRAANPSLDTTAQQASLFISMEMTSAQIVRRTLAAATGVTTREQRAGGVNAAEYEALQAEANRLKSVKLFLDGSGRQTMSQIASRLRSMKRLHGIRAAAIDHVKLIRTSHPRWTDIDVIGHAGMECKDLAKELDMIIFLLVQPTREGQKREHWRLRDQDIYGGDTIKQSSEILVSVALPHKWLRQREPDQDDERARGKWYKDCEQWRGRGEVGVLKARDAEDNEWRTLLFDGARGRFSDLT